MKIFMIGMGGSVEGANIEVHDMQFIKASSLEDTFDEVIKRWYGTSLHIDSYQELKYINGYEVDLNKKSSKKLFMIVYGGYNPLFVDEVHRYNFVLANSKEEAKKLGKENMSLYEHIDHIDSIVDVFENVGVEFGFTKADVLFKDNKMTHTYLKLK